MRDTLQRLEAVIAERRGASADSSYVASLFAKGRDKIAQKVGEEATETVIAALSGDPAKLTAEAADLLFHLTVLLAEGGVSIDDVLAELDRREGVSGITEKGRQKGLNMPIDPTLPYDDQNIFAKILRAEIPNTTVYEDEWALALHDIVPQAPIHILVIPKGPYVSWDDFTANASDAEIVGFTRAVGHVGRLLGLVEPGYRLLANIGLDAHQEIGHLHVHLFGGKALGPMLTR